MAPTFLPTKFMCKSISTKKAIPLSRPKSFLTTSKAMDGLLVVGQK